MNVAFTAAAEGRNTHGGVLVAGDDLAPLATGRAASLFAPDVAQLDHDVRDRLTNSRVLVIGGAGSIGSATVAELSRYDLAGLHVVDQNENGLAELVRDLRGRPMGLAVRDFRTIPLDFGSPLMASLIAEQRPYDFVLNFAAVKHVRSEKDAHSLLHMLKTNVLAASVLLRLLRERGGTRRYFCVSTDKAANPVNLMGASKRLMEGVTLAHDAAPFALGATSARFANVAFSDGSLLDGWLHRLAKSQPLAVPRDTRRYFISRREAGQLCLLAAVAAPPGTVVIPRLDPDEHLRDLRTIAIAVLEWFGLKAAEYSDEGDARRSVAAERQRGRYPLLVTPLDTMGEKPFEEFAGAGEQVLELGWPNALAVNAGSGNSEAIAATVDWIARAVARNGPPPSRQECVAALDAAIPSLHHADSQRTLDDRL